MEESLEDSGGGRGAGAHVYVDACLTGVEFVDRNFRNMEVVSVDKVEAAGEECELPSKVRVFRSRKKTGTSAVETSSSNRRGGGRGRRKHPTLIEVNYMASCTASSSATLESGMDGTSESEYMRKLPVILRKPRRRIQIQETAFHQCTTDDEQVTIHSNGEFPGAVIVDEHDQQDRGIVFLDASGELQSIERSDDLIQSELSEDYHLPLPLSIKKERHESSYEEHSGQTIFFCQDPVTNQESQFLKDAEGNFIPIEKDSAITLAYHNNQGNLLIEIKNEKGESSETLPENESDKPEGNWRLFKKGNGTFNKPRQRRRKKVGSQRVKKSNEVDKSREEKIDPGPEEVEKVTKRKNGLTLLHCMEEGCSAAFYKMIDLRNHLSLRHSINCEEEVVTFSSEKAFREWKENYEREKLVSFIMRGGSKKISKESHVVSYFVCHRTGHYKPKWDNDSFRQRALKTQGSCKIGGYCTSGIKLIKNLDSGWVRMEICHTHYGHTLCSTDVVPHLRVIPALRKVIFNKFREGFSYTQVLAYVRANPDKLEAMNLVDRKAVRNILDAWKNPSGRSKAYQQYIDEISTWPMPDDSFVIQAVLSETIDKVDEMLAKKIKAQQRAQQKAEEKSKVKKLHEEV